MKDEITLKLFDVYTDNDVVCTEDYDRRDWLIASNTKEKAIKEVKDILIKERETNIFFDDDWLKNIDARIIRKTNNGYKILILEK